MKQARNVLFTQFLDEEAGFTLLDPSLWPDVYYCVYQLESCPDTGRLHFQGYVEFVGKKTYTWMHENLDGLPDAHFEPRRGSQREAIAYCSKKASQLEGPWEWGEPREQGRRSDLLDIQKKILEKRPLEELHHDHFSSFVRYGKAFREYKRISTRKRDFKSIVFLIVGPSGTGKSRFVSALANYLGSVYKLPQPKGSGTYWDDYDGQDVCFIDEFDGNFMRPTFFNDLCDRYECVVPCHGGAGHQFVSRYIFIVSNYHPRFWWKKRSLEQQKQTFRRIDVTLFFPDACKQYMLQHHPFWQQLTLSRGSGPSFGPKKLK